MILRPEPDPQVHNAINTSTTAVFGDATTPLGFRLGNGGAGHTGLLRELCTAFIGRYDFEFRIEWVINHSRHTQIALLGDIVQVGLTYEPEWEDIGISEGWAERVTLAFHDRFILVGPASNPANVSPGADIKMAMRDIATHGENSTGADQILFHSRGDGSATNYKELQLWGLCGVDLAHVRSWRRRIPLTPYKALEKADRDSAYAITDRATFLTVLENGVASNLRVYVEDGKHLVNPCAALINLKAPVNRLAREFAHWLATNEAQDIIENFGKSWRLRLPIFAPKSNIKVERKYALVAKL
jgi:ABC-type tungstate transport system permease subunit